MRLSFFTYEYDRNLIGGAGIYALELTKWLADYGDLDVYSCEVYGAPPDIFKADWFGKGHGNVTYLSIPGFLRGHGVLSFFYYAAFQRRADRADVLLVNDFSLGLRSHPKEPSVQIIHHLPSSEPSPHSLGMQNASNRLLVAMERRALERATIITCDSEDTRRRVIQAYPEQSDKTRIVPNGVDVELFRPPVGDRCDSDNRENIILCIARGLEPRKGVKYLIEALPAVTEVTEAKAVIVGQASLSVKKQIVEEAQTLGVLNNIDIVDHVSLHDLVRLYQRAEVTVVPSTLEGFSKPTLESMACGTPVIGTAVGAVPELLDEVSGILIKPGDSNAIAEALTALLLDKGRIWKMGQSARRRVMEHFTWRSVVRRILTICEEALAST
ncbi:MAG TPA: glycosyltransferase family 4 protein [Candidatus Acidoferrales bacterium]|nr:glycosyltransferase family 4 protein [Candidatus Acidoferrales bacterium]